LRRDARDQDKTLSCSRVCRGESGSSLREGALEAIYILSHKIAYIVGERGQGRQRGKVGGMRGPAEHQAEGSLDKTSVGTKIRKAGKKNAPEREPEPPRKKTLLEDGCTRSHNRGRQEKQPLERRYP